MTKLWPIGGICSPWSPQNTTGCKTDFIVMTHIFL